MSKKSFKTPQPSNGGKGSEKKDGKAAPPRIAPWSPTTNAALSILLPLELCDEIQTIRAEHDNSFLRWPPHINLLWPFVNENEFEAALLVIAENPKFRLTPPIRLRLSTFSFTKGSKYLQLLVDVISEPNASDDDLDALARLTSLLRDLFPGCGRLHLEALPHVSLGQISQDLLPAMVADLNRKWQPIEFDLLELTLLARPGEQGIMRPIRSLGMPNLAREDDDEGDGEDDVDEEE